MGRVRRCKLNLFSYSRRIHAHRSKLPRQRESLYCRNNVVASSVLHEGSFAFIHALFGWSGTTFTLRATASYASSFVLRSEDVVRTRGETRHGTSAAARFAGSLSLLPSIRPSVVSTSLEVARMRAARDVRLRHVRFPVAIRTDRNGERNLRLVISSLSLLLHFFPKCFFNV